MREQHPEEMLHFIRYVNEEEYYEAHDVLESYWHSERINFYKGLIQVAVGSYHLRVGNIAGARALFTRAMELLQPYSPEFRALDVQHVLAWLESSLARIPDCVEMEREEVAQLGIEPIRLWLLDGTPLPTEPWAGEEEDTDE